MNQIYVDVKEKKKTITATAKKFETTYKKVCSVISFMEKGSMPNKLTNIRKHMYTKFIEARNNGLSLHYWHLRKWAREGARLFGVDNFKAFSSFLERFK